MNISRGGAAFTSSTGIDPSDATATAADGVSPKTFYVAEGKVTGLIGTDPLVINPHGAVINVLQLIALADDIADEGLSALSISGDIADIPTAEEFINFPAELTLSLTGNILNLQTGLGGIAIRNQASIVGDFATIDCPSLQVIFTGCSLLTGVLSPKATTAMIYLAGTNMSAADIDATLIALAAITTVVEGGYIEIDLGRTSASDAAVATLGGLGWTVSEEV